MTRGKPGRGAIGAALTLLLVLASGGAAEAALLATLAPGTAPGEIVFRLSNTGPRALAVRRAGTPLERELSADVLRVTRSLKGWPAIERAAYRGRRVKRAPPTAADFTVLAPGRSLAATVDVARHYAIPAPDGYRVAFDGEVLIADPAALAISSGAVPTRARRLAASAPLPVYLHPDERDVRARPAAFSGCDAARRDALTETTVAAEGLVAQALAAIDARAGPALASAPRYTRWFGAWAPARAERVRGTYAALLDSLSGATLAYDCRCDDQSLYAYVYPSRLHDVFVCPAFFRASLLGTDSRAGTLVHELSHFPEIGGTDDHAYGHAAVADLAVSNPALATLNADSYEYFAENSPPLAMDGGPPLLDVSPPADDDVPRVTALPLDAAVTGSLGGGDLDRFTAYGAARVTVDSLGGDADLYVFEDPGLDALVCASTTLERSGATERCALPEGRTAHIVVHAYTDTRYTIRASGSPVETTAMTGAAPPPVSPPVSSPLSPPDASPGASSGASLGGSSGASLGAPDAAPFDQATPDGPPEQPVPGDTAATAPGGAPERVPDPGEAPASGGDREPYDDGPTGPAGGAGGAGAPGAATLFALLVTAAWRARRRRPGPCAG